MDLQISRDDGNDGNPEEPEEEPEEEEPEEEPQEEPEPIVDLDLGKRSIRKNLLDPEPEKKITTKPKTKKKKTLETLLTWNGTFRISEKSIFKVI